MCDSASDTLYVFLAITNSVYTVHPPNMRMRVFVCACLVCWLAYLVSHFSGALHCASWRRWCIFGIRHIIICRSQRRAVRPTLTRPPKKHPRTGSIKIYVFVLYIIWNVWRMHWYSSILFDVRAYIMFIRNGFGLLLCAFGLTAWIRHSRQHILCSIQNMRAFSTRQYVFVRMYELWMYIWRLLFSIIGNNTVCKHSSWCCTPHTLVCTETLCIACS